MERCPTCRARLREASVCPRCRTDLSLPLAAEARSAQCLRHALAHLLQGDRAAARSALEEALRYKREPLILSLQGFLDQPEPVVEAAPPATVESAGVAVVPGGGELPVQAEAAPEPAIRRWRRKLRAWMEWGKSAAG